MRKMTALRMRERYAQMVLTFRITYVCLPKAFTCQFCYITPFLSPGVNIVCFPVSHKLKSLYQFHGTDVIGNVQNTNPHLQYCWMIYCVGHLEEFEFIPACSYSWRFLIK